MIFRNKINDDIVKHFGLNKIPEINLDRKYYIYNNELYLDTNEVYLNNENNYCYTSSEEEEESTSEEESGDELTHDLNVEQVDL